MTGRRGTLRRARIGTICLAAAALAYGSLESSEASAQRVEHRVRKLGENLRSIARFYYGDGGYQQLLGRINGLSARSKLRLGQRIRVPTAWRYRVPRTTTRRRLAQTLLESPKREGILLAFNPKLPRRVRAGTRLWVPFTVPHVVARGQDLASIARIYYGSADKAELISAYNGLGEGTALASGQQVMVPIGRVRILAHRLNALTNERVLGIGTGQDSRLLEGLREANGLIRRGEYWRVPLRLLRLLAAQLPHDQHIAEVYKLVAVTYVALGHNDLAERAFQEALLRYPGLKLDSVRDSPKVIRAFLDAKTQR